MNTQLNQKAPGRNDPCPCGSGKKYKKCCMDKSDIQPVRTADIESLISEASSSFENSDYRKAKEIANHILQLSPTNLDAIYLKGLLEMESGNLGESEKLLLKVQKKTPSNPFIHLNLAKLYELKRDFKKALIVAKKALSLDASSADANNTVGRILIKLEDYEEALRLFSAALTLDPNNPAYQFSYYAGLHHLERTDEAIEGYKKLIEEVPYYVDPYINLSAIYRDRHKYEESIDVLKKAIQVSGGSAELYNNLGTIYFLLGKGDEEISCYENALKHDPHYLMTYVNLLGTLNLYNYLDRAIYYADLILNDKKLEILELFIVGIYAQAGLIDKRDIVVNKIINRLRIRDEAIKQQNLEPFLMTLSYVDHLDAKTIFDMHRLWAEILEEPAQNKFFKHQVMPNDIARKPAVGFISSDFRSHPVGFFISPVLKMLRKELPDLYCYSFHPVVDEVTEEIKNSVKTFRQIDKLSKKEIAEVINKDNIDILVDLSGYTAKTPIQAFTYKPAPIQVSYLAYPNTTGLEAMDYRITDPFADVEDGTIYSEELVRLPECFLSFGRFPEVEINGKIPFDRNGFISFGSFNNIQKLNRTTISYMSETLKAVPDSKLVIKAREFENEIAIKNITKMFGEYGIDSKRLSLFSAFGTVKEHLDFYNEIDIALDSYPYNGTTTTCEALWMGVPVLSLTGKLHPSRVSYSILKNLDLDFLASENIEDFVATAKALSSNQPQLMDLRTGLRKRMEDSILCKTDIFAEQLAKLFNDLWSDYCHS